MHILCEIVFACVYILSASSRQLVFFFEQNTTYGMLISDWSSDVCSSDHAVHNWGGITLHDVIDDRYARKAIEKGADGLIAVAAGAGGHAGRLSPFALV